MPDTRAHRAYQKEEVTEEFRCHYGLNPGYRDRICQGGLTVAGVDREREIRIVELPGHPFFVATLFVPQFASSPERPHPLLMAYLQAAQGVRHE